MKRYNRVTLILLFSFSTLLALTPQDSLTVRLIEEGDEYAEKLFDNQKALQKYQEAFCREPANYEVLWRMSRTLVDIGEHLPSTTETEKQAQLKMYEEALHYAQKAIEANPRGSMGYARRAIVNGRIALFRGVWDALDLVKQTKADCEKAIELDPTNATAYYVLARTHQKVCEKPKFVRWPLGLGWANLDEAIQLYEKAITLRPRFSMYRLDCARTYKELKNYEKAKEHLQILLSLPKADEDDDLFKKQATDLLKEMAAE